ncbi:Hypp4191 [Branchiostoma lanceolatum]|uniref:Hypp4191 protein n=1 Tax=Branchiostoma lanceolatum TaxID=7740 RepID=A0A8K0A787_BRALA|nr:Hypp4191 [Branchiostoma lanceolatum]
MKTTILMKFWVIFLLVVLERTADAAPAAHRVTRSEDDTTASPSERHAARRRHNCMPPWSRQCQTSDSIIFKRSLKEQDLLTTAAVPRDSTNGAAAVSPDSTSTATEGNGQHKSSPASLRSFIARRSTEARRGQMRLRKILPFLQMHRNSRNGVL